MKTNLFYQNKSADKLRFPAKDILESQPEVQLTNAVKEIRLLIAESWLDWWLLRKDHVLRAFKHNFVLESNLPEFGHSLR